MPSSQVNLPLAAHREDGDTEQDREQRIAARLKRHVVEAIEEVGRERYCYVWGITEQTLSKQISGAEQKELKWYSVPWLMREQKSGRLARAIADYGGFLPFQRPEVLQPEEVMREVVALALAGEMGNSGREKVLALYARMKGGAR